MHQSFVPPNPSRDYTAHGNGAKLRNRMLQELFLPVRNPCLKRRLLVNLQTSSEGRRKTLLFQNISNEGDVLSFILVKKPIYPLILMATLDTRKHVEMPPRITSEQIHLTQKTLANFPMKTPLTSHSNYSDQWG